MDLKEIQAKFTKFANEQLGPEFGLNNEMFFLVMDKPSGEILISSNVCPKCLIEFVALSNLTDHSVICPVQLATEVKH